MRLANERLGVIVRPVFCRPFVGRFDELAYLHRCRITAASSRGALVLIAGDAGLGKSRLVGEFCASLAYSRWRVGRGACTEFARRAYAPILDALADAGVADLGDGVAASKLEQIEAIAARIIQFAQRKSLVLAIEDLHWADAATLELLAYLATRVDRLRVLIVATFRPDSLEAGRPASTAIAKFARGARSSRIDLTPFEGSELRSFVAEALGEIVLPEAAVRAVMRAGEGNPFFTEELLKSAVERESGDGFGQPKLPQTIVATVLERMSSFDPSQQRIVAQAAVIGRTFDVGLLARTLECGEADVLPTLRRARDVQLVEEIRDATFRFRHALTREAIYGHFLQSELRPLHRKVALAIESAAPCDRSLEGLAYHSWAAGDEEKSARYNAGAGDAAAALYAHEDAVTYYERALESSMLALAERGALLVKIAEQRLMLARGDEAQATFAEAADAFQRAGAYENEALARVQFAILAYTLGQAEPTSALVAMHERLDSSAFLARARVDIGLAWLAATFGFPTRAQEYLDRVDPRVLETPDIGLRFNNILAFVSMQVGDLERFRARFEAWVRSASATGSPRTIVAAYLNGAMAFSFFGLHEEAYAAIDEAERIARESHNRYSQEACHAFASLCYLHAGDLVRARDAIANVPHETKNDVNFTFATAWGTLAGLHLGDDALASHWFDGFAFDERKIKPEYGGGFAEMLVRRGRPQEAADMLARALPDCEMLRGNIATLLAVGRYGAAADRKRARTFLVRASCGSYEMPERAALALFDAYELTRDAKHEVAQAMAREAAAGFARVEYPLFEAAACEVAGDRAAALAIYERCGAAGDVRRLGGSVAKRAVPVRGESSASLSQREDEIARLAASGHTNPEIARRLSISHKTVEKHLASAFRKLGVSSRGELSRDRKVAIGR